VTRPSPQHEESARERANDTIRPLVALLHRHAGNLGRDADAARVRTSVGALLRAVDRGEDVHAQARTVQAHLGRLDPGSVTSLMRRTMRSLQAELGLVRR